MPERTSYTAGSPCWVDLTVMELDGPKAFYNGLFGWDYESSGEEMGNYTICSVNGKVVAGMMPQMPGSESPIMWNTYLATDDLDGVLKSARDAGANVVMEPMDVPEQGRVAYMIDPTGAPIGLWQAAAHIGAQLVNEPNTVAWNELHTPDSKAADAFYSRLFPYEFEQVGDGTTFDYAVLKVGKEQVAGRMRSDGPAHWLPYFATAAVDDTAAKVKQQGGQVTREPEDTPYGRMGACQDPWGATFSIITTPPR